MRLQVTTALVCAALAGSALAACGGSDQGTPEPSSSQPPRATADPATEEGPEPTTEEPSLAPVTVADGCSPELNALLLTLSGRATDTVLVDGFDLPQAMLDDLEVGCTLTSESPGVASTQTYAVVGVTADSDQTIDYVMQIYGLIPSDEEGYWHMGDDVPVGFDLPLAELVELAGGPAPAFEAEEEWVVVGVSTEPLGPPLG